MKRVRDGVLRLVAGGVGLGTLAIGAEAGYWLGRHGGTPTDWGAMVLLVALGLGSLALALWPIE